MCCSSSRLSTHACALHHLPRECPPFVSIPYNLQDSIYPLHVNLLHWHRDSKYRYVSALRFGECISNPDTGSMRSSKAFGHRMNSARTCDSGDHSESERIESAKRAIQVKVTLSSRTVNIRHLCVSHESWSIRLYIRPRSPLAL